MPSAGPDAAQAVSALLAEHGSRVYGVGLRLCGNPADAEEVVQETFLSAFRHWRQFEGRARPITWLFTIARRACLRRHRRRSGEPLAFEPLDQLLPAGEPTVPDLGEPDGPWRDQLRREAEAVVEAAISTLPVGFRLPLVLLDIAELSVAEVAAVLGLKENTVKTRVHRARLKLRQVLAAALPRRVAGPPSHPREVCLDLLAGKQEALDRGAPFPYSDAALCERCAALLATLDLGREACRTLGTGELPERVRELLAQGMRRGRTLNT